MTLRRFQLSLVVAVVLATVASAATQKVLYNFAGGSDGSGPGTALVFDAQGNLYGTTQLGGGGTGCNPGLGCRTIFKLSPNQDGSWTESILYSFAGGADGASPSQLTFDTAGNLYGTAGGGIPACKGQYCGMVFKLAPKPDGTWSRTVIYAFNGDGGDGRNHRDWWN